MRKGVLGINYTFYAVLSFVLVLFDQVLLCGLLLGFVMLVEKDEWTTRQCMQAFFLAFFFALGHVIASGFFSISGSFSGFLSFIGTPFSIIGIVIDFVFWVLLVIFGLMGLFRVAKGNEARVPMMQKYANKAYGIFQQAPVQQQYNPGYPPQGQPPMGQPQQPMGQPPMGQPQQPMGQQPPMNQGGPQQPPPPTV